MRKAAAHQVRLPDHALNGPAQGRPRKRRVLESPSYSAGPTDCSPVPFSADDLRDIESAVSKIPVQRARYPESLEQMTGRVHVRCSAAAPGGIYWFAVATSNGANANRFLSIFTTALTTGRTLTIFNTASDTSGNAWGCLAADCRTAWAAMLN